MLNAQYKELIWRRWQIVAASKPAEERMRGKYWVEVSVPQQDIYGAAQLNGRDIKFIAFLPLLEV